VFKKTSLPSSKKRRPNSAARGKPLKVFFQVEARFGRINEPKDCLAPPPKLATHIDSFQFSRWDYRPGSLRFVFSYACQIKNKTDKIWYVSLE
jgi:hypothetical protein